MTPALLALALLAAPDLVAAAGEVRLEGAVRLRLVAERNRPEAEVLFDPAAGAFGLDGYLVPAGRARHAAVLAALRLDGRHLDGALRWTLAVETGELRRERAHATAGVCLSAASPTGFDTACGALARPFPVPTTALEAPRVTANGRPLGEEVRDTLLVREASVAWSFGRAGFATLRAGRARFALADGLVHDDFATGVDLDLDLGAVGPPLELRAALFLPTRGWPGGAAGRSPVALLRADWLPSLFEHAGLFAAAARDDTGAVAELFRGAFVEDAVVRLTGLSPGQPGFAAAAGYLLRVLSAAPEAEATRWWAGASGSLLAAPRHRLTFTAALQGGELRRLGTTTSGAPLPDVPLRGRAVQLRWAWSPLRALSVAPWFLYLSGDRPPTEKHRLGLPAGYDGFLGITPFVDATSLFFGGGLADGYAARQATAPGVNGRGVLAPGLTVEVDPSDEVALTGRVAWLRAEDAGPWGGRDYGAELDLTARWSPLSWLSLAAEADLLWPGDFFGGGRTVSRVILALDLATP